LQTNNVFSIPQHNTVLHRKKVRKKRYDFCKFESIKKRIAAMNKFLCIMGFILLISAFADGKETPREKRKAREKAKMEEVNKLFTNRGMQFLAQSAQPMGGGMIHLTSEFTLEIEGDQVTSYLPYYGIAYSAEYGGGEGGIKFSETAASSVWEKTRNGYVIRMEVKTSKDNYWIHLTFSSLGYAGLDVTCQNRQPIHFAGIIQAIPEKTQ
jgi:hypothetical protein